MRFGFDVGVSSFGETLRERIAEYNTARELSSLRLTAVSDETSVTVTEGRAGKIGAATFIGTLTEEDGKAILTGSVVRRPEPTAKERRSFALYLFYKFFLTVASSYLLTLCAVWLFGRPDPLLSLTVPAFFSFCLIFGYIRRYLWSKRRFTRFFVAYMEGQALEDTPLFVRRKKRLVTRVVHRRHLFFWWILFWPVFWVFRIFFRFRAPKPIKTNKKRPCVMIANHTTDYDMILMALSLRRHMYFVMSEHALRKGFVSRLLSFVFDPIPRPKGTQASSTVVEMLRRSRAGYNTAIFAEGFRTLSGYNSSFSPGTGALVRKMGCDLVTYRIYGGYFYNPNWSKEKRPGKLWGEFAGYYTAEQLRAMTDEEVNRLIATDIYVDAYEVQKDVRLPYRLKPRAKAGLAEGLEYALFVCPECHRMGHMATKGDRIFCECGAAGTYNAFGDILSETFPFEGISEWYRWQESYIRDLPDKPKEEVLLRAPAQRLVEIDRTYHTDKIIEQSGSFTMTPGGFSIGEHYFPIESIAFLDIIRHGFLLFTTHDGRYFEVMNPEVFFPGMLVKMLYFRYSGKFSDSGEG